MNPQEIGEAVLEEMTWLTRQPYLFELTKNSSGKSDDGWDYLAISYRNRYVIVDVSWNQFQSVFGITVDLRDDSQLNPGVLAQAWRLALLERIAFPDQEVEDIHTVRRLSQIGSELLRRHDRLLGPECLEAAEALQQRLRHIS